MTQPEHTLPPFPVDDGTLDLLSKALNPGPEAERSSVEDLLGLLSEMGGSDLTAVDHVIEEGRLDAFGMPSDRLGDAEVVMMRDPQYSVHDVLAALIAEIRRLRAEGDGDADAA